VPDGTSETFAIIPAGCSILDSSCQSVAQVTVGWPVAVSDAEAIHAEQAAPPALASTSQVARAATAATSRAGAAKTRYILVARHAIARPKGSTALTAAAARLTVHSKTASYTYCSVGVFGLGKCAFWHATAKERFYYDGTKAFATLPLNNTNTYVNCADFGGAGYAVSVSGCGFLGRNPAPYGNGSYLLGREDFNVSLLIKGVGFQDHGYIEFHNFGDGFVGIHHGR